MSQITVTVRVVHSGKEVRGSLPISSTGEEVISQLMTMDELDLKQRDLDNNPIVYRLTTKNSGLEIFKQRTLESAMISEGDFLLLHQIVIAGWGQVHKD